MKANDDRMLKRRCLRDIVIEQENYTDDFFWLGRVPCRSVRFVGLLVGVQVYEKRMVYSGESLASPLL